MNVGTVLSDLIYGNPFATSVGNLIEEATEDFVAGELWQLFSGVCQAINRSPTGPKDAIRAIRRRFTESAQSNETVAYHSLLLLETCVLNCGYRFIVVLAAKDNLKDFARFANTGLTLASVQVHQKLLSLLQSWALKFGNQVDLREFSNVYAELKSQGIQFPDNPPSVESEHRLTSLPAGGSDTGSSAASASPAAPSSASSEQPTVPKPTKLSQDLSQVRVNICILSDLITDFESPTNSCTTEEASLLMAQIAESLQEMSRRLMQSISAWEAYQESLPLRGVGDSVLLDMLNVNDELHTVLARYSQTVKAGETSTTDSARINADGHPSSEAHNPVSEFSSFVGEPADSPNSDVAPIGSATGDAVTLLPPASSDAKSNTADDHALIQF